MPDLRVRDLPTVFALGDIKDMDENQMAWHIDGQVKVAANNIRALIEAGNRAQSLKTYTPQTNNQKMAVTLGSRNGVVQLPSLGAVHWSWLVRKAKAEDMLVPVTGKRLACYS